MRLYQNMVTYKGEEARHDQTRIAKSPSHAYTHMHHLR